MNCINRKEFLVRAAAAALGSAAFTGLACGNKPRDAKPPNIIFILTDDLGYGDLGCYGQRMIRTPNLDLMASQGTRFTDCYAGSTVCGPSRCCLLTGRHTGHARIRGNWKTPLKPEDLTIAEVLKQAGYSTAAIGKWGQGDPGTTGVPNLKGFDHWMGYLNRGHAHDYTPEFIYKNGEKLQLDSKVYTHDLFADEALKYVRANSTGPFFLYLAFTIPHANNELGWATGNGMEVPSDEPYSGEAWPQMEKNFAAMVTRMDRDVGRLLDLLAELGIDDNTLVFFTSDNGPHSEGGTGMGFFEDSANVEDNHDPAFFDSNGPLTGIKRDLYEGGIRVPMIVRWPGKVPAARDNAQTWAFWDVLPTFADIGGVDVSGHALDGVSVLPVLLGADSISHPPLYWECFERGFQQAAREGQWKAVRPGKDKPLELYDLSADLAETNDIAGEHPDIAARMLEIMESSRTEPDMT